MTITLCNGKGGSGKTTLTILLATALAEAGHDVEVLDTDPQKTATRWITETGHLKLASSTSRPAALFIDTPPRVESREVQEAIHRANVIVVVTSPSPADLFTSKDTANMIKSHGLNDKALLLFNQVQGGTVLARELEEVAKRIGLPAMKNRIHRRQAYQHAVLLGWKSLSAEAREEVFKAALEITTFVK